jgi:heme/copper-type cytochrome/quinol oxidase subunit 2
MLEPLHINAGDAMRNVVLCLLFGVAVSVPLAGATAQERAALAITLKNHHFEPAELHAPANRPLAITIKNLDAAAVEFESVSLRVEKIVTPGASGTVNVRPLAPGRYEFFDDFHQETRGTLIVQ